MELPRNNQEGAAKEWAARRLEKPAQLERLIARRKLLQDWVNQWTQADRELAEQLDAQITALEADLGEKKAVN